MSIIAPEGQPCAPLSMIILSCFCSPFNCIHVQFFSFYVSVSVASRYPCFSYLSPLLAHRSIDVEGLLSHSLSRSLSFASIMSLESGLGTAFTRGLQSRSRKGFLETFIVRSFKVLLGRLRAPHRASLSVCGTWRFGFFRQVGQPPVQPHGRCKFSRDSSQDNPTCLLNRWCQFSITEHAENMVKKCQKRLMEGVVRDPGEPFCVFARLQHNKKLRPNQTFPNFFIKYITNSKLSIPA